MNDILICLPKNTNNLILNLINICNKDLQFSLKVSKNNTINYVDLNLNKVDNRLLVTYIENQHILEDWKIS